MTSTTQLSRPRTMLTAVLMQKVVLLAFLTLSMDAGARPKTAPTRCSSARRDLFLSNEPASKVPELYVAGQVVTVLRFQQPCDWDRTRILGWEGRFEPVACVGKRVLVEPLKDLSPEDRFLLLVTLADGTELPFTVTARESRGDMQVDVYPDPGSPDAVRAVLEGQRKANRRLRAHVRHQRDEIAWRNDVMGSEDQALAMLLARGKVSLTGFKELDKRLLREERTETVISTLVTTERSANRKVAMIFQVTNRDPERYWQTQSAQVSALHTGESLSFVAQGWPDRIGPGQTGRVALVADLSSFDTIKDGDKIVFELFRDGGLQQGYIVWDVKQLLP